MTFDGHAKGKEGDYMRLTATLAAFAAFTAAAFGADGDFLTWGGYLSGAGMTGARTTMYGAGAGYAATDASHCVFIGTAAGYSATNASHCVFIGHLAGEESSNLDRCVGIGYAALAPRLANISGATDINGHFLGGGGDIVLDPTGYGQINTDGRPYLPESKGGMRLTASKGVEAHTLTVTNLTAVEGISAAFAWFEEIQVADVRYFLGVTNVNGVTVLALNPVQ